MIKNTIACAAVNMRKPTRTRPILEYLFSAGADISLLDCIIGKLERQNIKLYYCTALDFVEDYYVSQKA